MTSDGPNGDLASVCDVALTFPVLPVPQVDRTYLLDTIDGIFSTGISCIILEGVAEIGKTVLCAQYAQRHNGSCVCLFLGPYSDLSSDPVQIRFDIANQIHWLLRGTRLPPEEEVTLEKLRSLILVLQRKSRERKAHIHFVLDGLESEVGRDSSTISYLLSSILPIGSAGFRFLISGNQDVLPTSIRTEIRLKPHTVSFFSLSETTKYLSDFGLSQDVIADIHKTTRGIPGRLATVRRLLDAGSDAATILDAVGDAAADIFEPEWMRVDQESGTQISILAALAFIPECRSAAVLAEIVGISLEQLLDSLRSLTFITLSQGNEEAAFVSDSFQAFVRRKLQDKESWAIQKAIERLHGTADAGEAIRLLPQYLARTQNFDQLERLLEGSRLAAAVKSTRSISPILATLDSVRRMATKEAPDSLGMSCAFSRATLAEGLWPNYVDGRVRACVVSGNDGVAISLANGAETDELRLYLLSIIVYEQVRKGGSPSEEIVDEIVRLSSKVDLSELGDKAIEIAANLVHIRPDAAARVIESYAKSGGDSNSLDRAFVKLSLAAVFRARDGEEAAKVAAEVGKMAPTDNAKKFSREAQTILGASDAGQVLQQVEGLPTTSEKVFFIRQWLRGSSRKSFAVGVALGATRLILADTKYAPNAKVYRDLSTPLLYAKHDPDSAALLSFLQGQCAVAKGAGPVVDYFRMRFRLTRTRVRWFGEEVISELMDDALEVDAVSDLGAKAACYAWLVRCVEDVRRSSPCQLADELRVYALGVLSESIDQLLIGCAQHDIAVKGALQAIAAHSVEDALGIALRLNTRRRREASFLVIVESYLESNEGSEFMSVEPVISRVLSMTRDNATRQSVTWNYLRWIADKSDQVGSAGVSGAAALLDEIPDPDVRVLASAYVIGRVADSIDDGSISRYRKAVVDQWERIEDDGLKLNVGYEAIAEMRSRGGGTAGELSEKLRVFSLMRGSRLELQVSWRYLTVIQGRALAALAATKCSTDRNFEDLLETSRNILSSVERARLLARAALYVYPYDHEKSKQFLSDHVVPIVGECVSGIGELTTEQDRLLVESAPALWLVGPSTAKKYIGRLRKERQQVAWHILLSYVVDGRFPGEPWRDSSRRAKEVREAHINDILEILEDVSDDDTLAMYTCRLISDITDRSGGARVNKAQRADLVQRVKGLAAVKLPDRDGISHDGYKLLILVHILSLQGARQPEWEKALAEVRAIPNISDSCFILARTIPLVPSRHEALRNSLIEEMVRTWGRLPTLEEKIDRLETIYERCRRFMGGRIREMLESCIRGFRIDAEDDSDGRYRGLIELAYRLDEEWAASLVSVTDEDPARAVVRSDAKARLDVLRLEQQLIDPEKTVGAEESIQEVASACWRELGHLHAAQFTTVDWHSLIRKLNRCSIGSLAESYPVITLILASFAFRYRGVANVSRWAQGLMQSVTDAIAITNALMDVGGRGVVSDVANELASVDQLQLLSSAGDRVIAMQALQSWLGQRQMESLEVIDPYLEIEEIIDIVHMARHVNPSSEIRILTSQKLFGRPVDEPRVRAALLSIWAGRYGSEEMPRLVLLIVGRSSDGDMGIHDRWWLVGSCGLELGTSFGGIGVKASRIRSLDGVGVSQVRRHVEQYFQMTCRSFSGERLHYSSVVM